MARSDWIAPRPDVACGKVFLADRRSAEEHRIALELWILATHNGRMEYRLVPYRCTQCGGFHLARKKRTSQLPPTEGVCLSEIPQSPVDIAGDTVSAQ